MGTVLKSGIIPDFYVPTQIFIKPDIIRELGSILRSYGSRVVLVTTSRDVALFGAFIEQISRAVTGSQMGFIVYDEVTDSPNSEYADSAAYFIKKSHCDIVVGFGGLDALNVAKAAALLAGNNFFCEDLFEDPEANTGIPLITIPAYPSLGFEIMPMLCLNSLSCSARETSDSASICTARIPAFLAPALPMATVATGIPPGIWTVE